MWGGADYERIAQRFAPIHDELVARLGPSRRERWLDVGTGTGEVALRAARAGADVTAVDISAELLEQARAKAGAEDVRWELGDAQDLPYEDGSFEVVSSVFAAIFAPDQEAVGRELGRVCRPGGRLGLTAWRPSEQLEEVYAVIEREPPDPDPVRWSDEEVLDELLAPSFELELERGTWSLRLGAPEEVWTFWSTAVPPCAAAVAELDAERVERLRSAFVELGERNRRDGGVVIERDYVLVVGRRRP